MDIFGKVGSIMVRKVITASPEDSLVRVAKFMRRYRIGCVVITDKGRLAGIVSESDFIRFAASGFDIRRSKVRDYMTKRVITGAPSLSLIDSLMIMRRARVRHLPIVKGRRLVGIISLRDVIAATQLTSLYLI